MRRPHSIALAAAVDCRGSALLTVIVVGLGVGCGGMKRSVQSGTGPGGDGVFELSPDFVPNPTVVDVGLRRDQFDLHQGLEPYGFGQCGKSGVTTPTPAHTFRLSATHEDFEVRLVGSANVRRAALVDPAGNVTCLEAGTPANLGRWPEGTYALHPIKEPSGEPGTPQFVFTAPARAHADAGAQLAGELRPGASANPVYATAAAPKGTLLRAGDVGVGECAGAATPVAAVSKLVVNEASRFLLDIEPAMAPKLFIAKEGGGCVEHGTAKGVELPAGTHELWIAVPQHTKLPEAWEVAATDVELPLSFGDAPRHTLGAEPVTVLTTTGKVQMRGGPACGHGQRAPSFYLGHDAKAAPTVSLLHSSEPAKLSFVGPLERQFEPDGIHCQGQLLGPGTYAVWVDAPEGTDAVVLVGDPQRVDPLATARPVPANPSLAEREYGRYFAYYGERDGLPIEALFAAAPKQLFVFSTRATQGIAAGEPLLLLDHAAKESVVVTLAGGHRKLRTPDLTTTIPKSVVIPKLQAPSAPAKVHWYYVRGDLAKVAGPGESALLAAYERERDEIYGCVQDYRKEHDPTYDKNYDLVNLRTGKTLASKVATVAKHKCGFAKLMSKADRLPAQVVESRKRSQARAVAALAEKFE